MKHRFTTLLGLVAVSLFTLGTAHAQNVPYSTSQNTGSAQAPQPTAGESQFREGKGWYLGADAGAGAVTIGWSSGDDSGSSSLNFHFRFGGMLRPRLAVSAEFWSDGHSTTDIDASYTQNVLALAASYWLLPRLWVTTGVGSGTLRTYAGGSGDAQVNKGHVFMVGSGFEVLSRKRYSLDLNIRLFQSTYDLGWVTMSRGSVSFGLGATWH